MDFRNIGLSADMIENLIIHKQYVEMVFNWSALDSDLRQKLVTEFLEHEIEYDDQWYYGSIIIPKKDYKMSFDHVYVYVDEYIPDDTIYNEIANDISSGTHDWVREININNTVKVTILSLFIPEHNWAE